MRECMVLSAAMIFLATPRLWAGSTTLFQRGDQGGVVVPVVINGHGPFLMLLDTGASHSAVSEAVASVTAARPVARSHVISPTGSTIRTIVAIDQLSLGPHTVDFVLPSVVPSGTFDPEGKIAGLIGQDVLARFRYTIDFRQRTIEWHDGPTPTAGVELPLAFDHGRFLVTLPQKDTTLRLVPDSGAGGLVLFAVGGTARPDIVEHGTTVELSSAVSRHTARQITIRELRLGDRTLRNLPAVALDRPDALPSEGDGLLPLHLFERVTFDGPARLLILEVPRSHGSRVPGL